MLYCGQHSRAYDERVQTTTHAIQLASRKVTKTGQMFTFTTPSGSVARSLSHKRTDKGGALAFQFVKRASDGEWLCFRVVSIASKDARLSAADLNANWSDCATIEVDVTRPA
jgi:hypothetical protein